MILLGCREVPRAGHGSDSLAVLWLFEILYRVSERWCFKSALTGYLLPVTRLTLGHKILRGRLNWAIAGGNRCVVS
jgi:hypothetical protein